MKIVYSAETGFGLYCQKTEMTFPERSRSPLIASTDKVSVMMKVLPYRTEHINCPKKVD